MYFEWATWMMYGERKTQPKSGNFVCASFLEILSWCTKAWDSVARSTILSGVEKCYMNADPGDAFDVAERMEIEGKAKPKTPSVPKKIKVVKSKSPAELERLKKKEERARRKLERAKQAASAPQKKKPRKATPKRKKVGKSPRKRVQRRKTMRKKKRG